ncbi:aldo/keto reductase [Clostridia bacterium]|nr:aldo/keto reductase [Clostridia bacterium]
MKYRTFNKTGEQVSLLAFGAMRLPVIDRDMTKIDEPLAIDMIRKAIDAGVNYVDTAYPYHGGVSEVIVGKALADGYREKVLIADKYPTWFTESENSVSHFLDEQLKRLSTDVIDIYLIHGINKSNWELVKAHNILRALEKEKTAGKIKHIGFSYHDDPEFFKEVIDAYPWEICQIQLNFMDKNFQAGVDGLKYAAEKGIPVVVMEPLKGGKLTDSIPPSVTKLWEQAGEVCSPAEWAFKWVADFPEVLTILSGMSTMEQVEENLRILSDLEANNLTEKERALIDAVSAEYNSLIPYSCTACGYCLPCPSNIPIPQIIEQRNEWEIYKNPKIKSIFRMWTPKEHYPSNCTKCGACEEKCPQALPISDIMAEAAAILEG